MFTSHRKKMSKVLTNRRPKMRGLSKEKQVYEVQMIVGLSNRGTFKRS